MWTSCTKVWQGDNKVCPEADGMPVESLTAKAPIGIGQHTFQSKHLQKLTVMLKEAKVHKKEERKESRGMSNAYRHEGFMLHRPYSPLR